MSNEIPTDRAQLKALLSNQPPQSAEVIILLLDLKAFVAGAQKVVGKWPYKGANLQDAISLKESLEELVTAANANETFYPEAKYFIESLKKFRELEGHFEKFKASEVKIDALFKQVEAAAEKYANHFVETEAAPSPLRRIAVIPSSRIP